LRRWGLTVWVLVALAGGCGRSTPVPNDTFYRFAAPRVAKTNAQPLTSGVLLVQTIASDSLYGERALLYSDDSANLTLKRYHYHYWGDAPPRLLRQQLVQYLRAAKAAPIVVSELDGEADHIVRGRIKRFEHVLGKEGALARVALELRLEDRGGHTLLLKDYQVDKLAAEQDVASVVAAFDDAVNEVFGQFLADAVRASATASNGS